MSSFCNRSRGASGGRGRRRLPATALLLAGLAVAPAASIAQETAEPTADAPKARQAFSMRESIYKELARAQDKAEDGRHAEALKLLDDLSRQELSSYERTQLYNVYAFVYHAQERYPEAIAALKKLLAEEELDPPLETSALYSLAMLYFATDAWRPAIETIERWSSKSGADKPQAFELLAEAHYQLKEYRQVIPAVKKMIDLKRAQGEPVAERSYLILQSAYSELGEHQQVAAVLEELIRHYPAERYWLQLSGAYADAGDKRKQLNVMELAYLQGYLDTEQELLALAGLLLDNDLPYRAGKVLEKGLADQVLKPTLDNWRLLSQAWTLAHEDRKAIPALTRAAEVSQDGELDIVLAQAYINLEEWTQAVTSLRAGIAKGGLRRPDQAYVMLGQVLFTAESFDEARTAFERAQADGRSRKLAAQWLRYIDNEVDRQAQLRAALQE